MFSNHSSFIGTGQCPITLLFHFVSQRYGSVKNITAYPLANGRRPTPINPWCSSCSPHSGFPGHQLWGCVCRLAQICFAARTAPLSGGASVENPPTGDIKDAGSMPGSGRSPGGGNGRPLKYSYLENPMDRGTWQATVHGVAKSWTRLKRFNTRMANSHLPSV